MAHGTSRGAPAGRGSGWWRGAVLSRLRRIERGELRLVEGERVHVFGAAGPGDEGAAVVGVRDPGVYGRIALQGLIGAAEAYVEGLWTADDLVAVLRVCARNRAALAGLDRGLPGLGRALLRALHALRRNTRRGTRRNIAAHYDLGNEFFELFLDPTLTYSCGFFEQADSALEAAAIAKYERACRKLDLCPDDHVLEIGSGWGGFATYAAASYGCRITAITVSRRQCELARRRAEEAGLSDRVEVRLQDYRDVRGAYDKLVSIEMIEAVGHAYLERYFRACSERLRPDGLALIEAITLADQDYAASVRSVDFIKRYIFPGGQLPSLGAICDATRRATDLRIIHLEDWSSHYVRTLSLWRERFQKNLARIRSLGFGERFLRTWEYYFCYCQAGFAERAIGVSQILFEKPAGRRQLALGAIG